MSLRDLCNLAYAVIIGGIPPELRSDFDRRLRGDPEVLPPGFDAKPQLPPGHKVQLSREEIAEQNRKAMGALMGMMPGAARA